MITSNFITLYHGSINCFDEIDLSQCKPFKDFGVGFYTTRNRKQAENLAKRNRKIELLKQKSVRTETKINGWLYVYEFDFNALKHLSVKQFDGATMEWMRFVVQNRTNRIQQHHYDIVMGPTANDNTRVTLSAFFAGLYGDIQSDDAINRLITMIEADKLPDQVFFGSGQAVKYLMFKERLKIPWK